MADTGYDFTNPNTVAVLSKTYNLPAAQLTSINDAYKTQTGNNIDDQALMRAVNESQGQYLWGNPAGTDYGQFVASHPNASVSDPSAKNIAANGVYQNGAYTPNPGVAPGTPGSVAIPANSAITAPLNNNPLNPGNVAGSTPVSSGAPGAGGGTGGGTMHVPEQGGTGTGTNDPNSVGGLTGQLNTFDQNAKSPIDIYNAALSTLGISDARARVTSLRTQLLNTENLLKGVDASVTGRTQNSVVTEAQRQRLVAEEKTPLTDLYNTTNSAFGNAQADVNDIQNQGKTTTDLTVQGQTTARQSLLDRIKLATDEASRTEAIREFNTTTTENIRQFNVQQATQKDQFEKDLTLKVRAQTLNEQQAQDQRVQFEAKQAQDAAQFAQTQALEQAKLAETVRSNQASESISRTSASNKSAPKATEAENLAADARTTVSNLSSVQGRDGHVSNENWAKALNDWVGSGRDVNDFWSRFGTYVNPAYKTSYAGYNQQKVM